MRFGRWPCRGDEAAGRNGNAGDSPAGELSCRFFGVDLPPSVAAGEAVTAALLARCFSPTPPLDLSGDEDGCRSSATLFPLLRCGRLLVPASRRPLLENRPMWSVRPEAKARGLTQPPLSPRGGARVGLSKGLSKGNEARGEGEGLAVLPRARGC